MNALTHPGFISYFLTNTLSLLGIWILKVGMGWLSWQITQSTFWTSVVSLLLMAPVGLLGPFIAVFVERWDARRAMLATKFMMVVITTAIFVIQILGQHNLWTLVAGSTALGLLSAFQHPVRLVFISLVVPRPYLASAVGPEFRFVELVSDHRPGARRPDHSLHGIIANIFLCNGV